MKHILNNAPSRTTRLGAVDTISHPKPERPWSARGYRTQGTPWSGTSMQADRCASRPSMLGAAAEGSAATEGRRRLSSE
eukprot:12211199-Heterocapsa_arctica.AAC.1